MKPIFFILFSLATLSCRGQINANRLIKDLDGDGVKDTVSLDMASWQIVARLSTQEFTPIKSGAGLEHADTSTTYLHDEKNGFSYHVSYMRAGFSADFQYDKTAKKMRLTVLYEWNASSGMSGGDDATLNLLTDSLTIHSEYWDKKRNQWGDNEPIEKKIYYPRIYLSGFTTAIVDYFSNENARLAWGYSDQDLALAEDSVQLPGGCQYTWLGKLGKHIPVFIHFQLTRQAYGNYGEVVVGQIIYLKTKNQIPIPLIGYQDQAGKFRLNEYAPGGEVTGVITANQKGQVLEGSWSKPYADKDFELKLYHLGMQLSNKDIAVQPDHIFGQYHFGYGEKGPQGDMEVKKINARQATLSLFGVTAAPARNMADGGNKDTIALPRKSRFTYAVPGGLSGYTGCKAELHFYKHFVLVTYSDGGAACRTTFGHHATLEGIYHKIEE